MKNLILALLAVTIIQVDNFLWQLIDTDNKIVCYIYSSNRHALNGESGKLISCVPLPTEPVPAKK